MRRILLTIAAVLLPIGIALAQVGMPWPGPGTKGGGGGGGGFQGILDVLPGAKGCWGTIACSAATRGQAMLNLCDTAEGNCADAVSDATTGIVSSTQTRGGNPCGSTPGVDACLVHIAYTDGSAGNYCGGGTVLCNMVSATGKYLYFIPNAIGTIPALKCTGTTHTANGDFPGNAQPTSMLAAVRVDVSTAGVYGPLMSAGPAFDAASPGPTLGFSNATIDAIYNAGTTLVAPPAVSVGTFYSMIGTQPVSGGTGTMSINGSTATGTVGTNVAFSSLGLNICNDSSARTLTASFLQMAVYTADTSSSGAALTSNMRTNGGY
jgi:hypothetical protein